MRTIETGAVLAQSAMRHQSYKSLVYRSIDAFYMKDPLYSYSECGAVGCLVKLTAQYHIRLRCAKMKAKQVSNCCGFPVVSESWSVVIYSVTCRSLWWTRWCLNAFSCYRFLLHCCSNPLIIYTVYSDCSCSVMCMKPHRRNLTSEWQTG